MFHLNACPIPGSLGYLAVIYLLHKVFAQREALSVPKWFMVLYNFVQVRQLSRRTAAA